MKYVIITFYICCLITHLCLISNMGFQLLPYLVGIWGVRILVVLKTLQSVYQYC